MSALGSPGIGGGLRGLVVAASAALVAACGGGVKEPAYAVAKSTESFELRTYPQRVVAETRVEGDFGEAGDEGFRRLAGYIFGKNRSGTKLAMTAPVGMSGAADGKKIPMTAPVAQRASGPSRAEWVVSFTMPEGETLASLPVPLDARVTLRELPPARVAVVRFSGRWTSENMGEHEAALRAWARSERLPVVGDAEVNRYDPPFVPWFARRNEIWLRVEAPAARSS
ncbi:MAG TPA: heme-binding protein [Polyangiaceae bacterium]|nr:heme-binding protein [Polyangiaceae bacterium]